MSPDGGSMARVSGEALRESEERFKLLVESVRDYAIFMLDPDGYIVSWNAGAERIKGYTAAQIIGKHFSVFYPTKDIESGKPARELVVARQVGRIEDEGWRLRQDGTMFWANVIITALFDRDGTLRGFAKVTRDLTERRAREEAERRALLHEESSRQKDEFLAIVSHELRTPLNVATGQAAMLRSGTLTPAQADRAWASVQRNLAMLTQLIEDLLDISRIVTGKMSFDERRFDVRQILDESIEEITPMAMSKGLQLAPSVPGDASLTIVGDAGRLRQVMTNLLSNAVKFTPGGGRITIGGFRDAGFAVIRVADTGIGMESEFLSQVFDRFTQADATPRKEFAGLGVGLAIAREIVMHHKGTISAWSEGPGRGSTFEVRLPLAEADRAE